jgi:glycosyltransferase involved in cell wall biosynthesis
LTDVFPAITENYEIIFVDDGSTDNSFNILKEINRKDKNAKAIKLKKIEEGYDIVNGWRADRKDAFFTKKLPSKFSTWLASKLTGVKLHDFGCTQRDRCNCLESQVFDN